MVQAFSEKYKGQGKYLLTISDFVSLWVKMSKEKAEELQAKIKSGESIAETSH